MNDEFALFSDVKDKETYLDFGGARFCFSDYEGRLSMSDWSLIGDLYRWVLRCASCFMIPAQSLRLTEWINVIAREYFFWE